MLTLQYTKLHLLRIYERSKDRTTAAAATTYTCADPKRGPGLSPHPLENRKAMLIGFLSDTCPNSLNNHKATKHSFNVGPLSHFRWRAGDGPLLVIFGSCLPSSTKKSCQKIHEILFKQKSDKHQINKLPTRPFSEISFIKVSCAFSQHET